MRARLKALTSRLLEPPLNFGSFSGTEPVSRHFGYDRGSPIDRYYIEAFLEKHASDIRGRALEIGDASYCRRFGGERITRQDVLHVLEGAPEATIVCDLSMPGIPAGRGFRLHPCSRKRWAWIYYMEGRAYGGAPGSPRPGGVMHGTRSPDSAQLANGAIGRHPDHG